MSTTWFNQDVIMDEIIFYVATKISLKNSFTKFKLIYNLTQGYYSISLNK